MPVTAMVSAGPAGQGFWEFKHVTNVRINKDSVAVTYTPLGSTTGSTAICPRARLVAIILGVGE